MANDDEFTVVEMPVPVSHVHVKTIEAKFIDNIWIALMQEPNGHTQWMEQPRKPEIGEEQILYIVAGNSQESVILEGLIAAGAPSELIEHFLKVCAMAYGVWCEKSWDEVKAECQSSKETKH